MEKLSPLATPRQIPIRLTVYPFLFDHRITTGAVLPAVQTMQILADQVRQLLPHHPVHVITNAAFEKLLPLPETAETIAAILEIESKSPEMVRVALLTKTRSKSGIGRTLRHGVMEFSGNETKHSAPGEHYPADLATFAKEIPVNDIYPGLITFGPLFQNIVAPVRLFREGATTRVTGGASVPGPCLLGSPFPLDAAFHAACAWVYDFTGQVCFPVAFQRRVLIKPTQPGASYQAIIRHVGEQHSGLTFDLALYDTAGNPCELINGLLMKELGS